MGNWIIRNNAPSISVDDERVVIRSRRRVSIKRHDVLLLLSNKLVFSHQADVIRVAERKSTLESGDDKRWWEISIPKWDLLPQPIDLDLFSTSLTFIRNWTRPKLHVRHGYRRVPEEDLITIQRGEPFLARETYLTLSNALPTTLLQQFLAEVATSLTSLRVTREYALRSDALIRFIETRVLSIGRVLMDTQVQWQVLLQRIENIEPCPVYIWDEEDAAPPINLSSQAQLFRTLLGGDHQRPDARIAQLGEIIEVLSARSQQADELRFERIFRDFVDERR